MNFTVRWVSRWMDCWSEGVEVVGNKPSLIPLSSY